MNLENLPREAWIAIIVLTVLALGFDPGFFVLLFLAGLLYLARNTMESGSSAQPQQRYQPPRRRSEPLYREPEEEEFYEEDVPGTTSDDPLEHAADAIVAAGRDPNSLQVLPLDIGLLSFKGNEQPVVHQVAPVPDDVEYVQPYIQLRLPRNARGRIRFELLDSTGQVVYAFQDNFELKKGKNLIIPPSRMRLTGAMTLRGPWQLRVTADNLLLASHRFEWEDTEAVRAGIRAHIEEDGEISNELRSALAENRLQKMSLDELLSFQDDDDQQSARRS